LISHYVVEIDLHEHLNMDDVEALVATISGYLVPANSPSTAGPPMITMSVPADTLRLAVTVALAVVEPVAEPTGVRAWAADVSAGEPAQSAHRQGPVSPRSGG
jgi:hypothetical protein